MIKKLILDVDDTLFDFQKSERCALIETLTGLGISADEEVVSLYHKINRAQWDALERGEIEREALLTRRFDILFSKLGVSGSSREAQSRYEKCLGKQVHFIDGAKELLDELYGKYELYIASNGTAIVQDPRIEKSKIASYFNGIFISERVGYNKPDVRFFERCLSAMGARDKSEVMIFGDSLTSDILGGINAGIKSCWFNPDGRKNDTPYKPDYEVGHLLEFLKVLENVNNS